MTLEPLTKATLYFIGVSTSKSSIMKVFPAWAEALGLDAQIKGLDLPLNAPREAYRSAIEHIKVTTYARGALVTTHKLDVYNAAHDLFDDFDFYARLCGELSCISKQGDKLIGSAKDPISSGLSLEHFLPRNYWRETLADVLCLGAGGAAVAISLYLTSDNHKERYGLPKSIKIVDLSEERLMHIKEVHKRLESSVSFEYFLHADAKQNDALLASLNKGALVIHATGMGKDRPGSPLTGKALFPEKSVVWELNYRGELDFLKQAKAQEKEKQLNLQDGWVYFLHGWTQVITEVFELNLSQKQFERLAEIAVSFRGR